MSSLCRLTLFRPLCFPLHFHLSIEQTVRFVCYCFHASAMTNCNVLEFLFIQCVCVCVPENVHVKIFGLDVEFMFAQIDSSILLNGAPNYKIIRITTTTTSTKAAIVSLPQCLLFIFLLFDHFIQFVVRVELWKCYAFG